MQIFCVFPFVESFMMRCASFDAEGNVHTCESVLNLHTVARHDASLSVCT
eukprot:COSAG02_NODE_6536_length_3511_cov_1.873974_3_plen_50_part_00